MIKMIDFSGVKLSSELTAFYYHTIISCLALLIE